MYRKGSYIAARIAGLLAVVLLGFIVAVQTPYVQTKLTRSALDRLTETLDGKVGYDELRVLPSGVLLLKGAVILDKDPYSEDINGRGWERADTLFSARTITATFRLSGLLDGNGIRINRVNISDAMLHLTVEPGNRTNLAFSIWRNPRKGPNRARRSSASAKSESRTSGSGSTISAKP